MEARSKQGGYPLERFKFWLVGRQGLSLDKLSSQMKMPAPVRVVLNHEEERTLSELRLAAHEPPNS